MSLESGLNMLTQARAAVAASPSRELIGRLLDEGTFTELGCFASPEVITGFGSVDGAPVYVFAQDSSVNGGAIGAAQAGKIRKVYELAAKTGSPVVGIYDSHGAYLKEGVDSLAAIGELMLWTNQLSGVVPQISLITGTCGGAFALIAAGADLIVSVDGASLYLLPNNGEDSEGVVSIQAPDAQQAIEKIRSLVQMLPLNNLSAAPMTENVEPNGTQCAICATVDGGSFIELFSDWGQGVVTGFARVAGQSTAVVMTKGGTLDKASSAKLARLVRLADAFTVPVISFVDCIGFESVKEASMVAHAYAEATTQKIAVITGSAIGSAYLAMAGTAANADVVYAWPQAVISALLPETAVAILWNDQLAKLADPLTERGKLVDKYIETEASPFSAAKAGCLEEVIEPEQTRARLIAALDMLAGKRVSRLAKKHSNIQL